MKTQPMTFPLSPERASNFDNFVSKIDSNRFKVEKTHDTNQLNNPEYNKTGTNHLSTNKTISEKIESINKNESIEKDKKIEKKYYEVSITSLNFSFDDETGEFIMRTKKGEAEYQYPTESMLKMKKYILNQSE